MSAQAIMVIEAARALQLKPADNVPGLWRIGCEPRETTRLLRELGEAIAAFDKSSGRGRDPLSFLARAIRYAAANGIPAEEMVAELKSGIAEGEERRETAGADLKPQPGELGAPDRLPGGALKPQPGPEPARPKLAARFEAPEDAVPEAIAKAPAPQMIPAFVVAMQLTPRMQEWKRELGENYDAALQDGDESEHDLGQQIDAIEDRLDHMVKKVGWTPKLRILAGALMKARTRIGVEHRNGDTTFRMSASDLDAILKASAELQEIEANPDLAIREEDYEASLPSPGPKF